MVDAIRLGDRIAESEWECSMNWQIIPNLIRETVKGMRELQDMAGGRIRGQIVFWVCFVLAVVVVLTVIALCVRPAYEGISSVISSLNIIIPGSLVSNFFLSLGIAVLSVVFLAAIGFGIGALISMILILFLGSRIEKATDDILNELVTVIGNAKKLQVSDELNVELETLYLRADEIREKQRKRVANRIVRWFRRRSREKAVG